MLTNIKFHSLSGNIKAGNIKGTFKIPRSNKKLTTP